MLLLTCLIGLLAYFLAYHFWLKRRGLPPGPLPLPLLGNLPFLNPRYPHLTISEWARRFGPVLTIWIGTEPHVYITDFSIMKELIAGKTADQFAFRSRQFVFEVFEGGRIGLMISQGELWREQRRFTLHVLRDFGFGRSLMEDKIMDPTMEMVNHLRDTIGSHTSKVLCLDPQLQLCIGNIISLVILGRTYEQNEPLFYHLREILKNLARVMGQPQALLLSQMPWLRYLPIFGGFGYRKIKEYSHEFYDYIEREIEKAVDKFDPSKPEQTDFIGRYLKEIHERTQKKEDLGHFSLKQLSRIVGDIWLAGQETTLTTLRWGLLFMIHHPDIQEKIQAEIDHHFADSDQNIGMSDRKHLPLTTATVQEVQRLGNIANMNLPRACDRDFQIRGYQVPKGTTVIPQISAVFMDPKVFSDPEKFDPWRFLGEDGRLKKVEAFVPFSIGKRSCVGESLARMELFMIFATLLRFFHFEAVEGELPTLEQEVAIDRRPQEYSLKIQIR